VSLEELLLDFQNKTPRKIDKKCSKLCSISL